MSSRPSTSTMEERESRSRSRHRKEDGKESKNRSESLLSDPYGRQRQKRPLSRSVSLPPHQNLQKRKLSKDEVMSNMRARIVCCRPELKYGTKNGDFHVIRSSDDWNRAVQKYLQREVKHFRVFSIDTESTTGDYERVERKNVLTNKIRKDEKKFRFIVIGTCWPRTVIIDCNKFGQDVPLELAEWLEDKGIYKVGSGLYLDVNEDFRAYEVKSWVDTLIAVEIFERKGWFQKHQSEINCDRRGVATISMALFGWDYKPFEGRAAYKSRYGGLDPPAEICLYGWPDEKRPAKFYKWDDDNFAYSAGYMRADALVVLALGFQAVIKSGKEFETEKDALHYVFGFAKERSSSAKSLYISESEDESITVASLPKEGPRDKEQNRTDDEIEIQVSSDLRDELEGKTKRRKLNAAERKEYPGENETDDLEKKKTDPLKEINELLAGYPGPKEYRTFAVQTDLSFFKLNSQSSQTTTKLTMDFYTQTEEPSKPLSGQIQLDDREVAEPKLNQCENLVRHSPKLCLDTTICPKCGREAHAGNCVGKLRCEYPLCQEPFTHNTFVCPTLHNLCRVCLLRGHTPGQCSKSTLLQFKYTFTEYYQHGIRTRMWHKNVGWSFMPIHRDIQGDLLSALTKYSESIFKNRKQFSTKVCLQKLLIALEGATSEMKLPPQETKRITEWTELTILPLIKRGTEEEGKNNYLRAQENKEKQMAMIEYKRGLRQAGNDAEMIDRVEKEKERTFSKISGKYRLARP